MWERVRNDYVTKVGEEPAGPRGKKDLLLRMLPEKLEETFRMEIMKNPSINYETLGALIMDRLHEAHAMATPMNVDHLGPEAAEQPGGADGDWEWDDDWECWVDSLGHVSRAAGVDKGGKKGCKNCDKKGDRKGGKGYPTTCWICNGDRLSYSCPKATPEQKAEMAQKATAKGKGKDRRKGRVNEVEDWKGDKGKGGGCDHVGCGGCFAGSESHGEEYLVLWVKISPATTGSIQS